MLLTGAACLCYMVGMVGMRAVVVGLLCALAAPAWARAPRRLELHFPVTHVSPGVFELCTFVRLPLGTEFTTSEIEIRHQGVGRDIGLLHFLVYLYTGDSLATFAEDAGKVRVSPACLGLGPADRDRRQLVASGERPISHDRLPAGLAYRFTPEEGALGFLIDAQWTNGGKRTRRVASRVVLHAAKPGSVRAILQPILERTAERALEVAPFVVHSTEAATADYNAAHPEAPLLDAWGPGLATLGTPAPAGDACAYLLTGHFHQRGRFFGVDFIATDGTTQNPPGGLKNPFETNRSHLFATPDFTDPGTTDPAKPILVRAGERLHYACWMDNGVERSVRLGREEAGAGGPGSPGNGAAKPCTIAGPNATECPAQDAVYPGRSFTESCVLANLVAGTSPNDEVCQLGGFYYDAVAGAPAGEACDVSSLPVIQ